MKEMCHNIIRVFIGLTIFSLGDAFVINASLGASPWDILSLGISYHTPLTYGLASTGISLILLFINLMLKENIGLGTIIDALFTGNMVNLFMLFIPESHPIPFSVIMIFIGLLIMAIGQYFYMSAALGCGPRDAFLIAIGKRIPQIPIGFVEVIIFVIVFIGGFLLGGPIGVGTILITCLAGSIMHLVFNELDFEPRHIKHQTVIETLKNIKGN